MLTIGEIRKSKISPLSIGRNWVSLMFPDGGHIDLLLVPSGYSYTHVQLENNLTGVERAYRVNVSSCKMMAETMTRMLGYRYQKKGTIKFRRHCIVEKTLMSRAYYMANRLSLGLKIGKNCAIFFSNFQEASLIDAKHLWYRRLFAVERHNMIKTDPYVVTLAQKVGGKTLIDLIQYCSSLKADKRGMFIKKFLATNKYNRILVDRPKNWKGKLYSLPIYDLAQMALPENAMAFRRATNYSQFFELRHLIINANKILQAPRVAYERYFQNPEQEAHLVALKEQLSTALRECRLNHVNNLIRDINNFVNNLQTEYYRIAYGNRLKEEFKTTPYTSLLSDLRQKYPNLIIARINPCSYEKVGKAFNFCLGNYAYNAKRGCYLAIYFNTKGAKFTDGCVAGFYYENDKHLFDQVRSNHNQSTQLTNDLSKYLLGNEATANPDRIPF